MREHKTKTLMELIVEHFSIRKLTARETGRRMRLTTHVFILR